jgi:hypothetical protein
MTRKAKLVAAALAAVNALLAEEAAAAAASAREPTPAALSLWGLAGRMAVMNTRLASRASSGR